MPSGPRILTNNVFGTVSDNPLTAGATTLNSAGLADLAAVSSAFAVIVIDPERTAGAPEIVFVTAHTGSATSATIARGKYGSSARQHAQGTPWVHAATKEDLIQILTSSTRPSDPYEGDLIYETDTDRYVGYDGSAWATVAQLGAWSTWSPTFGNFTVGNATVTARYVQIGKTVHYRLAVTLGNTSAMGTNPYFTLPVTAVSMGATEPMGVASLRDEGTADYQANVRVNSTTTAGLFSLGASSVHTAISSTAPFTWTTNDKFYAQGTYEAA